jgi:hypothetical protein
LAADLLDVLLQLWVQVAVPVLDFAVLEVKGVQLRQAVKPARPPRRTMHS